MLKTYTTRARTGSAGQYRWIFSVFLTLSLAGCAAMDGVNVGANIPIGGVINVGANKTIGSGQAPAQKQQKVEDDSEETDDEDE
jgi:hypothetical protein